MSQGGGGRVLCYFHTYVGSSHFCWFKILNLNIFGVFRKIILWIFLGVHHKIELYLGVISMHSRVFS